MIEKTKLIMIPVFTLCFLSYSVLIGKFYEKFHVSREIWIGLCGLLSAALVVAFIMDLFFAKHEGSRNDKHE